MTLPIAFYREAFRAIDDLTPPGTIVNHAMQTNATLITAGTPTPARLGGLEAGRNVPYPRKVLRLLLQLEQRPRAG